MRRIEFVHYGLPTGHEKVGEHPLFRHMASAEGAYTYGSHPGPEDPSAELIQRFFLEGDPCREAPQLGHPLADALLAEARAIALRGRALGASNATIRQFMGTRNWVGALRVPADAECLYLPTFPSLISLKPWFLEVEDVVTVFHPFAVNGLTYRLDLSQMDFVGLLQALLERPQCLGVVAHVASTAEALKRLFAGSSVVDKIAHVRAGIPLPAPRSRAPWRPGEAFPLLFTASWHQLAESFVLRGGREALAAARILLARHPELELWVRSALPASLAEEWAWAREHPRVKWFHEFMAQADLEALHREARAYLLPSARLHVVSLLEAQAHGLPVLTSDGWALDEYVLEGETGWCLPGRGGVSRLDGASGMLVENYHPMFPPEPVAQDLVDGLVASVGRWLADPPLHEAMAQAAQAWVVGHCSPTHFNAGLEAWLDGRWPELACRWAPPDPHWQRAALAACEAAGEASLASHLWGALLEAGDEAFELAFRQQVQAALEGGDLDRALPRLKVAMAFRGSDAPWLLMAAYSANLGGEFPVAEDFLGKALTRAPQSLDAWLSLVAVLLAQDDLPRAKEASEVLVRLHPEVLDAWVARAELLARLGEEGPLQEALMRAEALAQRAEALGLA